MCGISGAIKLGAEHNDSEQPEPTTETEHGSLFSPGEIQALEGSCVPVIWGQNPLRRFCLPIRVCDFDSPRKRLNCLNYLGLQKEKASKTKTRNTCSAQQRKSVKLIMVLKSESVRFERILSFSHPGYQQDSSNLTHFPLSPRCVCLILSRNRTSNMILIPGSNYHC